MIAYADANHLMTIFAGKTIEELPYRFQPSLNIIVDYDEYVAFCELLVKVPFHPLSFNKGLYTGAVLNKNKTLLTRLYYYDMSSIILQEVSYSTVRGVSGTKITHNFSDKYKPRVLKLTEVMKYFNTLSESLRTKAIDDILKVIPNSSGCCELSSSNALLLDYALLLRALSYCNEAKIININMEV